MTRAVRAGGSGVSRIAVAIRAVAAVVGSYALAATFAAGIVHLLPLPRIEAVVTATLLSYLLLPVGAIWAFAAPTPLRALIGFSLPIGVFGVVMWLAR